MSTLLPAVGVSCFGRGRRLQLLGQPAFWLFVAILAAAGVATLRQQSIFRDISPSGWLLAWTLMIVYALPIFVVVFTVDLFERESIPLVIAALLWGGIAAAALAAIANRGWALAFARIAAPDFASEWTAALVAPGVEETLKLCGVVLIYLMARREIRDLLDGFVYGAICGLGFLVVEDVFYFMGVFGGRPVAVLQGFFLRIVAGGLYGHLLYTGLSGMGVAYFATRKGKTSALRRISVAGALVLLGMFAHFLWNSPWLDLFRHRPWSLVDLIVVAFAAVIEAMPFVLFVVLTVVLARRREARWLGADMETEVDGQALLPGELEVLRSPRLRREAVRDMHRRAGPRAAALLKRLQRMQIDLAMVRSWAETDDDPALMSQRAYCRSLRDALSAVPAAAPASR